MTLTGILVLGALTLTGCYDKPGPGTAQITVVDTADIAQTGVHVRLYCSVPKGEQACDIDTMGVTNSRGLYQFESELPMVLRVRAVRYDTTITITGPPSSPVENISVDSLCGEGFVTIRNDETTPEVITLLQCK